MYLSVLFVPKDVRLNSTHFILKINNKRELENIAINHSADIGYKDFVKIYRECTKKKPFSFLTIDKTIPESVHSRFRKKPFRPFIKMKSTDELKIFDDKIDANQARYDLAREAAKTSALSSRNLDKYEYFTGGDLRYKPRQIEIKRAEHSPLARIITKAVKKDDKLNNTNQYINNFSYVLSMTLINRVCLILIK